MENIGVRTYKVHDGEEVTFNIRSTGNATFFGVNYSVAGHGFPLKEGEPFVLTMDKSSATGSSSIPNAKRTNVTMLFSFTSSNGGKYDIEITGTPDGRDEDRVEQDFEDPGSRTYRFHIV